MTRCCPEHWNDLLMNPGTMMQIFCSVHRLTIVISVTRDLTKIASTALHSLGRAASCEQRNLSGHCFYFSNNSICIRAPLHLQRRSRTWLSLEPAGFSGLTAWNIQLGL